MDNKEYRHIKTEIGVSPVKFNVALAPINFRGTLGELNMYVLKELGYDNSEIEKIDVSKGYSLLDNKRNKPILFIVTVGSNEFSGITLQRNLRNALSVNEKLLKSKNVWVPLMATGVGKMSFVDSYDTTYGILKNYANINFTIAIPDDNRGKEFINQFKGYNFHEKAFSSSDIEQIQNILNTEFTIALEKKINLKLGSHNHVFDLADISNLTFVELKFQESPNGRANIRKEINSLISRLSPISPNKKSRLIVVIHGVLTKNDRNFYETNLRLLKNEKVILYDKNDIEKLSRKHNSDNGNSKSISNSDTNFNEQYKTHRFIRDVLNKAYNLNLVIEETRIQNGFNIRLDLSDEEAKSYVKVINKDFIDGIFQKTGITYENELSKIAFDITTDLGLLNTNNSVDKYFVFFDDSFDNNDIEIVKKELTGYDTDLLQILTMSDITLLAEKNNVKLIDYIDIENSSNSLIEESNRIDNGKDKIPFHLDQVVNEDKLGRAPVAKEFVRLLKSDIFTDKLNHSFMVHLQGKWGAGKSSFLNFIKHNLRADGENWVIVDYNAWQNQHISPPWWSFIDQVYLQSRHQIYLIGIRSSLYFRCKEGFRRIWRYSGWDKIVAFIITLLSIICIIYFGEDIITLFSDKSKTQTENNSISFFGDFGKLVLTLSSLLGALYGFTKFITVPFFINSSKEAKSFVLRASDPMNQVKKHFNDLVDNINSNKKNRQLAIFIDDIDRCDKEYIVQLLEGIQTLFKDKRVLYIVAGDKNWISTSFGNTYKDFVANDVEKKQLGESFIEKAFQLSFRLPNISEESKQNYWDHVLGMNTRKNVKMITSIDELTENKQVELKYELLNSKSELTNPSFVKDLQEKYNFSGDTVSNIVIEEKNKNTEELKHLLQEYHKYIDTNPRSIIRLANNYTMARTILMAERVSFNEHKLFRWLVIEDLCPEVKSEILSASKISELEEFINEIKDLIKRKNSLKLFKGVEEFMQGEITIEDIKTIKGL